MRSRGPLAIGGFLAIPVFFCSLMAASLALEKPHTIQWRDGDRLLTTWHPPTSGNEARIWLFALLPPLLLMLVAAASSYVPYGFHAVCAAAVVDAAAVTHRLDLWVAHHTARFPNGVDLIPASNAASDKIAPGEWETNARDTALSLAHWTWGIAAAATVLTLALALRRRRARMAVPPPSEGAMAESRHASV
jgi:hypothetical protein